MKWFLGTAAYAMWCALDHPEHWNQVSGSDYRWEYKKRVQIWVGMGMHICHPGKQEFGIIDGLLLRRKFNHMRERKVAGEFTTALFD